MEFSLKLQRRIKMRYESDILEMIHEKAMTEFQLGLLTEAEMRKYDELCLPEEALQDNTAHGNNTHETVNIEQADLVTA
jgi:DNA-binding transcriptional regulator YiaG